MINFKEPINVYGISERETELDKDSGLTIEQAKLMKMFYTLECSISNAHSNDVEEGNWNYIPYSHLKFYKTLLEVTKGKDVSKLSFLEMGCGLGTKLHIASKWVGIGTVDGIEINPYYAKIAQKMVDCGGKVYNKDVLKFTKYHKYDIIYSYGEKRGAEAERPDVTKKMKDGAIYLEAALLQNIRVRPYREQAI
jgi:hypothetical protein